MFAITGEHYVVISPTVKDKKFFLKVRGCKSFDLSFPMSRWGKDCISCKDLPTQWDLRHPDGNTLQQSRKG